MSALDQLFSQRYGSVVDAPEVSAVPVNPVLESLLTHRSVRAFLPDRLPDGTLETLIAAAQSAASSSNLQTWSVIAVEDALRKAEFAEVAGGQTHIRQAPLFLVWLADLDRPQRIAASQGLPAEAVHYLDTFLTAVVDAALAAQNVVVAAESLGLGTVYIGALRNDVPRVIKALKLPEKVFPVFGLVIGHPDPAAPAAIKPRLPQQTVLFRETYQVAPQAHGVSSYDQVLRRFQAAQNLPEVDWSLQSAQRLRGVAELKGRERLRGILNEGGFRLE